MKELVLYIYNVYFMIFDNTIVLLFDIAYTLLNMVLF